jgi:hypothetical protein
MKAPAGWLAAPVCEWVRERGVKREGNERFGCVFSKKTIQKQLVER